MKKIITALNNPKINEAIAAEEGMEVITQDVQYQEGVIEILEKNNDIEILILSSVLIGEKDIYEFIQEIKQIKDNLEIIIILEKEEKEIEKYLMKNGIINIFYNNKNTINELINLIKKEINKNKIPDEINEEIKKLKEMILENNNIKNNKKNKLIKTNNLFKLIINKLKIIINYLINKILNKNKIKIDSKNKIINIIGTGGVGKSVFTSIFAKLIKNKKIILLDFNNLNNKDISTIFGVNKNTKKINKNNIDNNLLNKININKLIIKINSNLFLISETEKILNNLNNILQELLFIYDLIIIDAGGELEGAYLKEIMEISDINICLVEPNLINIKKIKILLEKYINKWKIKKEKINIIFNKYNFNSINNLILKGLFSDFNILGEIKINNNYNFLINSNLKLISKKIKREFVEITKKII